MLWSAFRSPLVQPFARLSLCNCLPFCKRARSAFEGLEFSRKSA
jgi:hypothetical protein